jgi:hypothetical protein
VIRLIATTDLDLQAARLWVAGTAARTLPSVLSTAGTQTWRGRAVIAARMSASIPS